MKQGAIQIFKDATFTLHKWNSNAPELEQSGQSSTSEEPSEVSDSSSDESTFAKQQLGTKSAETKLLGTPWNKLSDALNIPFPTDTNQDRSASSNTKREVLSQLAKVYDRWESCHPLQFVASSSSGTYVRRNSHGTHHSIKA